MMQERITEKAERQAENRFRLFEDLSLVPHPVEWVLARKTASGVFDFGKGCNTREIEGLGQNCSGPSFRVLWTGDGTLPTGESIQAHAFELGFSEAMDPASMTNATATLTPEGGSAVALSVTLGADGRSAILTGAELTAGAHYALHFEGLKDRSGNALQPEDRMLNVADPESFEVVADTSAPVLLAVMDGSDGIYLLFDEAVQSADMASAIQLKRQGDLVEGESQRVSPRVLKWHSTSTDLGGGFFLGAQYSLSVVGVEDLAGNAADASAMSFTHLAGDEGQLLIARQAPTDSYPMAESAYGLTTLFQGRTWHSDLGMYYYRARWYLPDGGVFGERDPLGRTDGQNVYNTLRFNPTNFQDPRGEQVYVVYRAFNGPFLKRAYSLVGHFFLAFAYSDDRGQ